MRILITGGAGFIGLNLARDFGARGHSVSLLDSFARGEHDLELKAFLGSGDHRLLQVDLLAPQALAGLPTNFDIICHLAAIVGVETVRHDPMAVLRDNIAMNLEVLRFAQLQTTLHRLVFASTSEVYAGTLEKFSMDFPTPESTPLALPELSASRTSYMLSKIYGEALSHHCGVPFTIVRPHNIYGPRMGMSHVVPQIMQRIWQCPPGEGIVVYSPNHLRTFCYVEDAVRLIAAAAEAPSCSGATLNIGNTSPEISMAELTRLIAGVMGRSINLSDGPVTPGSPSRRQPSIEAVCRLTGQTPRISLQDGLERTFNWYREHKFTAQLLAKS